MTIRRSKTTIGRKNDKILKKYAILNLLGVAFLFEKISVFITDTMIEGKIIQESERDLYNYCFGMLIETAANLLSAVVLGMLLNRTIEALIFMAVFISMRSTAGGYHCETSGRCYILSMTVFLIVILACGLMKCIPSTVNILLIITDLAAVLLLSPVESPNKPLNEDEKNNNRRVSVIASVTFTILSFILLYMKNDYAYAFIGSITAAVISMVFGYFCYKNDHSAV